MEGQIHLNTLLLFIHYHHDSTDCHKAHYSQLCMWQSRENTSLALCFNSHPRVGSRHTNKERNQTIKEWKHQARSAASHEHTSNEHTAPISACNTAPDTLNCVLSTLQPHEVLGKLRENYKRYLSPLFPLTVIRSFHVPGVLFTLPRFHDARGWEM